MILQTDVRLNRWNPLFETDGCTMMMPHWFANHHVQQEFTPWDIHRNVRRWQRFGWASADLSMLQWQHTMNDLGLNVIYLGKKAPDYLCRGDEFEVLNWYNDATELDHFTAGNGEGVRTYDPLGDSSITVRDGRVISKRIFRFV